MAAGHKVRQFARAALKVAGTVGDLEGFLDRFGLLAQAFRENRALRHLLITRRMPTDKKVEVLQKAFGKALTGLEFEITRLLLDQGLGNRIPAIARSIQMLARSAGARMDLTVFYPQALSEKELQGIGDRVGADLDVPLKVSGIADPALLGGIKMRLGNTLVDGTLARRLELLRERLV